jgi:YebC/PmpR family DNA-binding regulatory protein
MSGHSKWANIRIRKGAQDAKRGKIAARHGRLIEMAARAGGGDPTTNNTLRNAIDNAKAESVPNANIERAISKGTGELKGEAMAEVLYAAMGPGGTSCLIECLTDNKNRTINNIRSRIEKQGGRWTELGSVQWMFERKGVVVTEKGKGGTPLAEDLELQLIDAGAEDIDASGETIEIVTDGTHWPNVRNLLKAAGTDVLSAGLQYVPKQKVTIGDAGTAKQLQGFIENLEEDDDVAEVHTNADIPDEIAKQLV